MDLTSRDITEQVQAANSRCPTERTKFIFEHLIQHLHDFIRETSITQEEWMTAIQFLTDTGKKCSDIRQEFILLSDVLGVSSLLDILSNAKPHAATESTVLGPFYTEDTLQLSKGDSIASEGKGEYLYVEGCVLDTNGHPISGATIDTWESDGDGLYDTQYTLRDGPECRGRFSTAEDGSYGFRAVVPVPYPIPDDGPVGDLVKALGRDIQRPAHLHIMIQAPGFEKLVTALYFEGDPHLSSDPVLGVRRSLVVKPEVISDVALSKARGFEDMKPHTYIKKDFVLATPAEVEKVKLSMATSS